MLFVIIIALAGGPVRAQYYDWGASPVSTSWRKLKTDNLKLIYPKEFEAGARRVAWYLDTVRTHIGYGFRHGPMRTPVIVHTRNTMGNGMAMWAPKRIEMLAAPASTYSEPWLKQLAIHEYRHNVQYNNLRRGWIRPLMWLMGEHIAYLSTYQFSIFVVEGDAVMAETEFSAFGRGLQPSWTMHYRAMEGDVGTKKYSTDYWFSGSYRNYVPDHYRLGYQMVRWSNHALGQGVWDDMARYVSRNPYMIVPMGIGMRRHYGMGEAGMFRRTFADLNAHWDSLPKVEDSSERIVTPERSYTTYEWPLWIDDGATIVAFKRDMKRSSHIVWVDAETGRETFLTSTGVVSSRPAVEDCVLWWTEFRRSMLWPQKVNSRLCSFDLTTGRKQVHGGDEQVFYSTPLPGGGMARVAYDRTGRFSIVNGEARLDLPANTEVTGLAWDDVTGALYFIGLDDGGMFLAGVEGKGFNRLTPSRHITISDLRAGGGRLYFGSIVSGKDEAHAYDLATGVEYRLSESAYGSFQPSTPRRGRVALTTYDKNGYHLATQNVALAEVQEQRDLPLDLVNPPWKRWALPKMDSLVYTPGDAERSVAQYRQKRFNKMLNIFQPHSWLPVDDPSIAIPEADPVTRLGVTLFSQSLLSDAVSWLSYGWVPGAGPMNSRVRGGLTYSGLGPVIEVDFSWGGGPQLLYTPIPQQLGLKRKPQLSVTSRLSLPLVVSSGAWYSAVTAAAEHFYNNGLIYNHVTANSGKLTRGVERFTFSVGYSGQTRMAPGEFLPRWGFTARVGHVTSTNRDFRRLWIASMGGWMPGVVRPHSVRVRAAAQEDAGPGDAPYMFRVKEVLPRGAIYDFIAQKWRSASVDYQLPVWYPEGGIPGVLYFKRVRLNLFADYAHWRSFKSEMTRTNPEGLISLAIVHPAWHRLYSYGGDITLDLSPLRLPATNILSATFTIAKPSDQRGVFFSFGVDIPL
jgi:hypothetical protein